MQSNVVSIADAQASHDFNAAVVRRLVDAYAVYAAEELPKLVAALYESNGKGGGSFSFTASLKWTKDMEIDFQAIGSEKNPPKVLLEEKGEITGKKQLNLF